MYSKVVTAYDAPTVLNGRKILAVYSEFSFVALLLDNDEIASFAVDEVTAGRWFEVFPICSYDLGEDYTIIWTILDESIDVISSAQLWREEWQETAMCSDLHPKVPRPAFSGFFDRN